MPDRAMPTPAAHLLVDQAVSDLTGTYDDLTSSLARKLLRIWRHYPQLTEQQVEAVIAHFPAAKS